MAVAVWQDQGKERNLLVWETWVERREGGAVEEFPPSASASFVRLVVSCASLGIFSCSLSIAHSKNPSSKVV